MNMVASVDDDIAEIEHGKFMSHQNKVCKSGKQQMLEKLDEDKYCSNDDDDGYVPPQSSNTDSYQHCNTHTINSTNNDSRPPQIAKQRSSISVNPLSMRDTLADIADLVDSDSEEEGTTTSDNKQMPSSQPSKTNPNSTGGPEHRPFVGGFAAAAYEAARLDHYKKKGKLVNGHLPRPGKA